MRYNEEQVNDLIDQVMTLNQSQRLYNVRVEAGVLKYMPCVVGLHSIKCDSGLYHITAADDSVIVGVNDAGETKIVHSFELGGAYEIVNRPRAIEGVPSSHMLPGIGASFTHHTNGNRYLVLGYANERANPNARENYPVTILYVGGNGCIWAKTLKRFNETMLPGGEFQFQENIKLEYMGLVENECLVNGFMTKQIAALAGHVTVGE